MSGLNKPTGLNKDSGSLINITHLQASTGPEGIKHPKLGWDLGEEPLLKFVGRQE